MTSSSSAGASVITLQFALSLSLDVAEQEVQAAINAANSLLPADLPAPPIYAKVNPADAPILTLAVTSDTLPLTALQDMSETRLAQKISQQPGVGLVSIAGGKRPAVRIQINPPALAALGLNIDDVRTTLANTNVNIPKGSFDGAGAGLDHQRQRPAHQPRPIRQHHHRLSQRQSGAAVGCRESGQRAGKQQARRLGQPHARHPAQCAAPARGQCHRHGGFGASKLLPTLLSDLPAAVNVDVLTDRTDTIRASVADVEFELMLAIVLVVAVIFLFLRTLPATLIPSLSVPLSLVGTFGVMYLLGYSLNNLSLMALTISTGFVVDDAIVMIENIARYVEDGMEPMEASLRGSSQIGFTIISLTISLIAVLIPLLFMGDVVGRLFHEFAITLAVTIVISAVVSLTLVPMLCARLIRHRPDSERGWFDLAAERVFNRIIAAYARALDVVLRYQPLTLMVALGTLALTAFSIVVIPKGFFPGAGHRRHPGHLGRPADVSFQEMVAAAAGELARGPAQGQGRRLDLAPSSAWTAPTDPQSGRFLINLKPHGQRDANIAEIIRRLSQETESVRRREVLHPAGAGPDHRCQRHPRAI